MKEWEGHVRQKIEPVQRPGDSSSSRLSLGLLAPALNSTFTSVAVAHIPTPVSRVQNYYWLVRA